MPDLRLSDDAATRRAGAPLPKEKGTALCGGIERERPNESVVPPANYWRRAFQGRATLSSSLLNLPFLKPPQLPRECSHGAFFRLVRVLRRRSYSAGQFIGARRDTIGIVSNHALHGNSTACLIFEAKCLETVSFCFPFFSHSCSSAISLKNSSRVMPSSDR